MNTPALVMGFASFVPNALPFYEMRPPIEVRRRKVLKRQVVKKAARRRPNL